MNRNRSAASTLGTHLMELGTAAPVVVAHRMAQMAAAGSRPSARDRREFALMSNEKVSAAWESWMGMTRYAMTLNTAATQAAWAFWMPWAFAPKALPSPQDALLTLATAGVAPYRRMAMANDRRLSNKRKAR
ncbi:hypothetical protein OVA13_14210 [Pseudoxanthomonas sp. SL93]|jgi:hypothetical protein|uniref:hypothetical protein n=1 Tax=Pseudoxanthomonas sp. SL93 TaxID=2995142 RepID=UPI002271AE26|nr:hypothetical protein [Pseudoxanthomonas sp. SL93]WAC62534.1 hypothetical protein OVA13_14210 [Pseudoxanthomonas sp. SL93]